MELGEPALQKRFEYRIETIKLPNKQAQDRALVAGLNELGKAGWLVCQIGLTTPQPTTEWEMKVLLVRSLAEPLEPALSIFEYDDDDDDDDDDDNDDDGFDAD